MLYPVEEFGAERFFDVYISFLPLPPGRSRGRDDCGPAERDDLDASELRTGEHMQQAVAAR